MFDQPHMWEGGEGWKMMIQEKKENSFKISSSPLWGLLASFAYLFIYFYTSFAVCTGYFYIQQLLQGVGYDKFSKP